MFIYTVYICFKRNGDKKIRDTDIYSAILIDFNKVRFIHIYENTFYKHKGILQKCNSTLYYYVNLYFNCQQIQTLHDSNN